MTKIGVLVPVCSRNQTYKSIDDTPLLKIFIKGFDETREEGYNYDIFIGIDDTDDFYMTKIESIYRFGFLPVVLNGCEHKPAKAWNMLLKEALNTGCEYFYQIGDDVELQTKGWTSVFITKLQSQNNVGVVGPFDKNNPMKLNGQSPVIENAFFHKTHYDIFGYLFYPKIDNYYCDEWLTEIYRKHNKAHILEDVLCNNVIRDARYNPRPVNILNNFILEGYTRIANYQDIYIPMSDSFTVFVDVSIISRIVKYTGIQHVVKSIAYHLANLFPATLFIQFRQNGAPITHNRYTESLRNLKHNSLGQDTEVIFKIGDVLFLLDDNVYYLHTIKHVLSSFKKAGLTVVSLVHSIIPITHPQYVTSEHNCAFTSWIKSVENVSSGIITVSQATKTELRNIYPDLSVKSFLLGCSTTPSDPGNHHIGIHKGKNVLMVGKIIPRKCYVETLLVFEKIWETRQDINLVIVGRQGYLAEKILDRINSHLLLNKNLFLLNDVSDTDLTYFYKNSDIFLFSSDIEAFDIQIINAASHGLPLVLRDRPVFREIAGENALYFDDFDDLQTIITDITDCRLQAPKSSKIKTNDWADSALECLSHLLKFRMEHIRMLLERKIETIQNIKVFCINLERAKIRYEKIIQNFERLNQNLERFEACDGDTLEKYSIPEAWNIKSLSKGEVGCALSHYTLWKKIYDDNIPYACILEDDAIVVEKVDNISVPFGFDIVYINENTLANTNGEAYCGGGTYGYIVSRKGVEKLLKICSDLCKPIDLRMQVHVRGFLESGYIHCNDKDSPFESSLHKSIILEGYKTSINYVYHDYDTPSFIR